MNCKIRIQHRLLAAALLMIASASVCSEITFKNGTYGGLLLGINYGSATWSGLDTFIAADNQLLTESVMQSTSPAGETNSSVAAGHPFFGYLQRVSPNIYVATELGGTFSNDFHFAQNSSASYFTQGKTPFLPGFVRVTGSSEINADASLTGAEFDLDFKGGFTAKKRALIYARGGLAFNILKIYDAGGYSEFLTFLPGDVPPRNNTPIFASGLSSNAKHVIGLRLGLGTEYLVSAHFGILFDYVYTRYGNIETHTEAINRGDIDGASKFGARQIYGVDHPVVTLSTQAFMLGLSYHT